MNQMVNKNNRKNNNNSSNSLADGRRQNELFGYFLYA